MTNLSIVDCHHHLWDLGRHRYEWLQADPIFDTFLGDYTQICRDYLIDDYLTDAGTVGITKSVHVQCEYDPADPAGETRWLQGIADRHGFPHGIVGYANLARPDVGALLEAHAAFPNTRGIRQNLNFDPNDPRRCFADRGDYLTDDAWWRGFSLLERFGMTFDLQVLPRQMADAYAGLSSHPGVTAIVDHVGLPLDRDRASMEVWRAGMRDLARLPNTAVKLSGFAMMDPSWTDESVRSIVLEVIEMFGVDRAMFAGNFPVDGLYAGYEELYGSYLRATDGLETHERQALFAGNAERIYRI